MRKINVLERINNFEHNPVEFDGIKNEAGRTDVIQQHLNNFILTVSIFRWLKSADTQALEKAR